MFKTQCNIDKTDRINRVVIGVFLLIVTLVGASKLFYILLAVILIVEGVIGWCSIPYLLHEFRNKFMR